MRIILTEKEITFHLHPGYLHPTKFYSPTLYYDRKVRHPVDINYAHLNILTCSNEDFIKQKIPPGAYTSSIHSYAPRHFHIVLKCLRTLQCLCISLYLCGACDSLEGISAIVNRGPQLFANRQAP